LTLTAIISDLHSNWPALETAISDARERGARRFVCLGDVIGYGARPCICLDEVMKICTEDATFGGLEPGLCLLGNHEYAILNHAEDFNPNARAAIDWTRDQINGAEGDKDRSFAYWDFLGGLEPMLAGDGVLYAHGSPRDPVRECLLPRDARDEDKMAALFMHMREASGEARVCFVGHSHVPGIFYEDGRYYRPKDTEGPYELEVSDQRAIVNVGSVGQPRDGDTRLSYAMWGEGKLTFVRAEYDVAMAQEEIRSVPELPEYLADRLGKGR